MILRHRLTSFLPLLLLRMPWEEFVEVDGKTMMCRDVFPSMTRTTDTACVVTKISPAALSNTAVVSFEIKEENSRGCVWPKGGVTVAMMMLNDVDYPCGRSPESFGPFDTGIPTFCTLPKDATYNVPWNSPTLNAFQVPCFFHKEGEKEYLQPVSEHQLPSLFVFDIPKDVREQSRIVWEFELPSGYNEAKPKAFYVVGELMDKATRTVYTFGSYGTARLNYKNDDMTYATCKDNPTVYFYGGSPKPETSPAFMAACEAAPEECQYPPPKIVTSSVFSCRGWKRDVERVVGSTSRCVTLVATPTRQENSVLVGLVMDPKEEGGACGGGDFEVEAWLLQANNEEGYPVGRINETFPVELTDDDECALTSADGEVVAIGEGSNVPCFFHESGKEKYIQQVDEFNMPSLFYGKTGVAPPSDEKSLFAHIWKYAQPPSYAGRHPTQLQFQAEVFLPKKQQIYVLRASTPLNFTFLPSPQENTDPNTPCFNPPHPRSSVIPAPNSEPVDPDAGFLKACKASEECPMEWVRPPPGPTTTTSTTPTPPPPPPSPVIVDPEPPPNPPPIIPGKPPPPIRPPPKRERRRPTNVYEGCVKRTKGCIVPPKGQHPRACLSSETCELVIAFQRQDAEDATDDVIVIELYHVDPGEWFAMGINFSNDTPRMGDTFVVECVDEGDEEGPVIYNSYNAKGKYDNKRYLENGPEGAQKIIQKKETYRRGRGLYCRFHLATQFIRTPMRVDDPLPQRHIDLNRYPVFVVAAWGSDQIGGPDGNLRKHKSEHILIAGQRRVVLSARYAPTASQKTFILQHGVFTTWAFLFALPTGNFLARFLKETFPNIKICRRIPLWLVLHVGLMTSTVALVVAGMAVEIYGHVGWISLSRSSLHTFLGGATGGLLLANFFFGFFVNVSHHTKRNLPGIAHSVLGQLVQVGGCVLLIRSGDLSFGNSPCHVKWIVGAWIFSFFVAHAIMGYHYCWVDWVVGLRTGRSLAVSPIGVLTEAQVNDLVQRRGSREINTRASIQLRDEAVISAPGARVRLGGFALFVMISFMYSAWTTTILATNERGPCAPPHDNLDEELL